MKKSSVIIALLAAPSLFAQAPLAVEGITDRNYGAYADRVTVRVPSTNGYTYQVWLDTNRIPTDVSLTVSTVDYHQLRVWRTNQFTGAVTNRVLQFIIRSSERSPSGSTEDGLPPWTPRPVIPSGSNEFAGAHLRLLVPADFPAGYEIPVAAWVENDQEHAVRVNGPLQAAGHPSILLKRGVGSGFLAATNPPGALDYRPRVAGLATNKLINLEPNPTWTQVSGTLSGAVAWPAGSRLFVTTNLTIAGTASLTIGAGTIVRLNPGVNLYADGQLVINGTREAPVVFMPNRRSQPWGGFYLRNSTSQITATGALFTGSGADPNGTPTSHRKEQSLFFCNGAARVTLTDSAAIWLAGQLGHAISINGTAKYFLTFDHFLAQGMTTGGEYTDTVFNVNDSAFIDCFVPTIPYQKFNDGDEDGIYIVNIPAGYTSGFTNTLIGWTRDDGVDSGGSGSGLLTFKQCWFEGIYHEANSLSGNQTASPHADKLVRHIDDVMIGCGQGLEDGYGAPTGRVDHCLVTDCQVGARFGDNYNWVYYGFISATNSLLLYNYRDVWGMNWADWTYRTNAMDVRGNFLTAPDPRWPANQTWNPSSDGWRLAPWMTTPAEAPVGIGLAVWTNQLPMTALLNGAPVRLSSFTAKPVRVNYTFSATNGPIASGTLEFAPGETVKTIYSPGFDEPYPWLRLVLSDPANGELTGETALTFQGSLALPQLSFGVPTNQWSADRLPESVFLTLSAPALCSVKVDFRLEGAGQVLTNGNVAFTPGQSTLLVPMPTVNPGDYDLLRLSLSNPLHAQLSGITTLYLLRADAPGAAPRLNASTFDPGQLTLAWADGTYKLVQSDAVNGPWTNVPPRSPAFISQTNLQTFFRLRKP